MIWPKGFRCAAVLSFDVDGEAGMLQADPKNSDRASVMSWARYGPKIGVPRILDMLKAKEVKATFFVPGYTAELYPDLIRRIAKEGHEVGAHGYLHEPVSKLNPIEEEISPSQNLCNFRKLNWTQARKLSRPFMGSQPRFSYLVSASRLAVRLLVNG